MPLCQETDRNKIVNRLQNKNEDGTEKSKRLQAIGKSNRHIMSQREITKFLARNRLKR